MAKEAARLFIKSLPSVCKFNVMSFGSGFTAMFDRSIDYSKMNIEGALSNLKHFQANMGGTEIY